MCVTPRGSGHSLGIMGSGSTNCCSPFTSAAAGAFLRGSAVGQVAMKRDATLHGDSSVGGLGREVSVGITIPAPAIAPGLRRSRRLLFIWRVYSYGDAWGAIGERAGCGSVVCLSAPSVALALFRGQTFPEEGRAEVSRK
jgi:hypothetical protein